MNRLKAEVNRYCIKWLAQNKKVHSGMRSWKNYVLGPQLPEPPNQNGYLYVRFFKYLSLVNYVVYNLRTAELEGTLGIIESSCCQGGPVGN